MKGDIHLKKPEDFLRLHRKGSYSNCAQLSIKNLPNGLNTARWGISVGKKLGSAVPRNRIKRRFREIIRRIRLAPGNDIIFIARQGSIKAKFADLQGAVIDLLNAKTLIEQNEKSTIAAD
jgi:ribonuclease P protein component